jgi:hypothetical protein
MAKSTKKARVREKHKQFEGEWGKKVWKKKTNP